MKYITHITVFTLLIILSGCGALEPKYYPEKQTITSTLFPSDKEEKNDPEFEQKVIALLEGKAEGNEKASGSTGVTPSKKKLAIDKGKLLIINNLTGVDTQFLDDLKEAILTKSSAFTEVEYIGVSSLPNLQTLRLMGARQQAKYVLILNSFSNVYRYHNAWTIPTIFGLGIPYFFLDTQTIKVFAKIEYSLIDIKENVILSNESVTAETEGKAILPESGIVQYKITNEAISTGVKQLGEKFLSRI
jgi:hypothetical protein